MDIIYNIEFTDYGIYSKDIGGYIMADYTAIPGTNLYLVIDANGHSHTFLVDLTSVSDVDQHSLVIPTQAVIKTAYGIPMDYHIKRIEVWSHDSTTVKIYIMKTDETHLFLIYGDETAGHRHAVEFPLDGLPVPTPCLIGFDFGEDTVLDGGFIEYRLMPRVQDPILDTSL
jgi:hypothetical protein